MFTVFYLYKALKELGVDTQCANSGPTAHGVFPESRIERTSPVFGKLNDADLMQVLKME